MIVAIDATALVYLIDPEAPPPIDANTGKPLVGCAERVELLVKQLEKDRASLIIPTPALAEVMTGALAAAPQLIERMHRSATLRITAFDEIAAIECAIMQAARREKFPTLSSAERRKAKFDEQIVAIAKVAQATAIYSDDHHIRKLAEGSLDVFGLADLPLPPEEPKDLFNVYGGDPQSPGVDTMGDGGQ